MNEIPKLHEAIAVLVSHVQSKHPVIDPIDFIGRYLLHNKEMEMNVDLERNKDVM